MNYSVNTVKLLGKDNYTSEENKSEDLWIMTLH